MARDTTTVRIEVNSEKLKVLQAYSNEGEDALTAVFNAAFEAHFKKKVPLQIREHYKKLAQIEACAKQKADEKQRRLPPDSEADSSYSP